MKSFPRIFLLGVVALCIVSLVTVGCSPKKKEEAPKENPQAMAPYKPLDTTSKRVAVKYKGGKITEGELNLYVNYFVFRQPQFASFLGGNANINQYKAELAKDFAGQKYIASRVDNESLYLKKADQTLGEWEKQMKSSGAAPNKKDSPKSVEELVKGKGITKAQLRFFIAREYQVSKFFEDQLKGTKYDKVKLQHILISIQDGKTSQDKVKRSDIEAKKRALEVKKRLESGADFSKLAKEYSDDPGSKTKGGMYEGTADQFVPEFALAAKTLTLNKISDPIRTSFGYHIMKVLNRTRDSVENAPDQVKQLKQHEAFLKIKKQIQFNYLLPVPKAVEK